MLRIKDMTIFSISLETLDKSPRALAKIRAGYSSCHSAPVVPHSKYTNLSLLTLIIHKQHKGWNRAGWSLFMAPKCFIPLKMCPKLFLSPARHRVPASLFQPWVALQFGLYNRSICLILRIKYDTKHSSWRILLNLGNGWSARETMARDGGSRMVLGAPGSVYCLVRGKKAPGDGKRTTIPRRTHKIHLPSPLKKKKETRDINLIGLSRHSDRTSLLIGKGRTKQTE